MNSQRPQAVWLDGAVTQHVPVVAVDDRTAAFGDGIFTTMRTLRGRVLHPRAHWRRLRQSADAFGLTLPDYDAWSRANQALIAHCDQAASCRIKWLLTRGPAAWTAPFTPGVGGLCIAMIWPLGAVPTALRLATVAAVLAPSPLPRHQTCAYLDALIAQRHALARGADEAIRLFPDATVGEGAAVNLYAVLDNTVVTPPALGILPGVVRSFAAQVCAAADIGFDVRPVTHSEFLAADAWLASSALLGVCGVVACDGHPPRQPSAAQAVVDTYWRLVDSAYEEGAPDFARKLW